jgi:hypothetical protein
MVALFEIQRILHFSFELGAKCIMFVSRFLKRSSNKVLG